MKLAIAFALSLHGALGAAATEPHAACDAARRELERHAREHGLVVQVRCRATASDSGTLPAAVQASPWPEGMAPRGGALTWPVQVLGESAVGRTQRIPLTVSWTAPAWVASRALVPGTALCEGDLSVQLMRWPEGVPVQAADPNTPPAGRLRHALNAGDMLLPQALHPTGTVLRGDAMTARLVQGAIEVRLPAELLSASRVGQRGLARLAGRAEPVEGRIADAQTFIVEAP